MSWGGYKEDENRAARAVADTWGVSALYNPMERSMRVMEEATEAMQCAGLPRETAHRIVDMVFDKPPGELNQEIFGVWFTLMALTHACGVDDVSTLFHEHMVKFEAKDPGHFRAKQQLKVELGVSFPMKADSIQPHVHLLNELRWK